MSTVSRAMAPLISVVICTRNRAKLLRCALTSLVDQQFPRGEFEIVVVDNASSDQTPDVVREFEGLVAIRRVYESDIGLCVARNTGWRAASGRYVAYFDDDAIAAPGWLAAIMDGFNSAPPGTGVIGGRVDPIWEEPRPPWLADEIAYSLTIVDWGPSDKLLPDLGRQWLVGANMAIPKTVLEEIGGFHPRLDRVGDNLLSSGDVFLQKEIVRRGYSCWYRPAMAIGHLVPATRLRQRWFLRRYFWQGVSDAVMDVIEREPSLAQRRDLALTRASLVEAPPSGPSLIGAAAEDPRGLTVRCRAMVHIGYVAGMLDPGIAGS